MTHHSRDQSTQRLDPVMESLGGVRTPNELLDAPGIQERVYVKMGVLSRSFDDCFAGWTDVAGDFFLNESMLRTLIESYFCDLYRLKFFRGIHNEDQHKQAGFLMKWIAKIRPIQRKNVPPVTQKEMMLNEYFAFHVAVVHLGLDPREVARCVPEYARNIIYLLLWHSCSAEQLASEMYLLERLIRGTKS